MSLTKGGFMKTVEVNSAQKVMANAGIDHVWSAQIVSRILDKVVIEHAATKEAARVVAKLMMEFYYVGRAYVTGPDGFSETLRGRTNTEPWKIDKPLKTAVCFSCNQRKASDAKSSDGLCDWCAGRPK
jgi:hypothetical protein